ncbi:protein DMP10-like [Lolium rigidum]|uniref:protein DMP10-like n=1 Tax=Lolium rigidum TaxID=89674 RepID=UPI001F5DEE23|nr:protein DMP10-like [Lolium rigidum]
MALASPASPSPIVIQMPPLTSAGTATTTPKDAGDFATAPTPSGPKATATDKVMSSAANLAQLLPTGTVLAYQALAPSFTNHGKCENTPANRWLTAALVAVLATFSLVFSFTDSVVGPDQKLYYGIATPRGFNVFNFSSEEEKQQWDPSEFRRLRVRLLDYIHAVFTAMVFLTVALSDVGLRNCFFPNASRNTEELLKNLPLGMAFFSSFVFMIFPTKRKGIGYTDTAPPKKVVT